MLTDNIKKSENKNIPGGMSVFEDMSDVVLLLDDSVDGIVYSNARARKVLHNVGNVSDIIKQLRDKRHDNNLINLSHIIYDFSFYDDFYGDNTVLAVGKPYIEQSDIVEAHVVTYDNLTGLASGDYFNEVAERIISDSDIENNFVFVYFNVDNFKAFNSTYGFTEGDKFLCNLANVISSVFLKYIVARTSNDHFIVLTNNEDILEKVKKVHEMTHEIQRDINVEVNAGIYEYEPGVSMVQAHDRAKIACDVIKGNYSREYCYYDENIRHNQIKEKYIVDNIDMAIEKAYLEVYYQPIQRVFSGKLCAMESLIRWNDPELGMMSPIEFIPVLEKRHLIHKVDKFVIDCVCRNIQTSRRLGETVVPVSVNLSRLDFQLMDAYEVISSTALKYDVAPRLIRIEVTESALSEDLDRLVVTLRKFHDAGFEVWLDDFGSEYSTLNSLQNYGFDLLKIDMNFFKNFDKNENSRTIISAVTDMAKRLKMRVLAEGIETREQYEFLKKIGCDKAQGYFISRPVPLESIYGMNMESEDEDEARYFSSIGEVNVLEPNPIAGAEGNRMFNMIPTAMVQLSNMKLTYLYANDGMSGCLQSIGINSIEESEKIINNYNSKIGKVLNNLLMRAHATHNQESIDFVFDGNQINFIAREIAQYKDTQAYFVTMMNLSSMDNVNKMEQLDKSLKYLYSFYDRVDYINVNENIIENVYMNSQYYSTRFTGKSVDIALNEYSINDISAEDREQFLEFYNISTLKERFGKTENNSIIKVLNTMTTDNKIREQLYIIIRIGELEQNEYLSCVRDLNELEKKESEYHIVSKQNYSNGLYKLLSNELGTSVLEWDVINNKSECNGRAYKYQILNYEPQQIYDRIVHDEYRFESIYSEDIILATRFCEEVRNRCERSEVLLRLKMVDGTYRWSRVIGLLRWGKKGELTSVTAIVIDVEKEQKYFEQSRFINSMPMALGIFEVQGKNVRQIFMNDRFFELVEDDRENRIRSHKNFLEGIHPDDRKNVTGAMKRIIEDGESTCGGTCRVITGKGVYKNVLFTSAATKRQGGYILVYSTYTDAEVDSSEIEGRRRIIPKQDLLDITCNELKAAVLEIDYENKKVRFSHSCDKYALSQQKEEDIFANRVSKKMVFADDYEVCRQFFAEIQKGAEHADSVFRMLMIDGTYRWSRISAQIRREDGVLRDAVCVITDIDSDFRQKRLTEHLLNDIPIGVGIFDIKDGIAIQRYINDAYYRMVKESREERIKKNENSFFYGICREDWPAVLEAVTKVTKGDDYVEFYYRARMNDESTMWIRMQGNVTLRARDKITVYCCFSNVTETYNEFER